MNELKIIITIKTNPFFKGTLLEVFKRRTKRRLKDFFKNFGFEEDINIEFTDNIPEPEYDEKGQEKISFEDLGL